MSLLLLNMLDDHEDVFEPFSYLNFGAGMHPHDLNSRRHILLPTPQSARTYQQRHRNKPKCRSTVASTTSTIGKDGFQVCLDVEHFAPNEITVNTVDNHIVVEGRHEEKEDEHGNIYRHFIRRYELPEEYDINEVASTLSSDGILTLQAPLLRSIQKNEREITIQQTGPAYLSIKSNSQNDKKEEKMTE